MLKQWHQLTAAEKRRVALRVEGLRAVDRTRMAAAALVEGHKQDALDYAGEARSIIRLALRKRGTA